MERVSIHSRRLSLRRQLDYKNLLHRDLVACLVKRAAHAHALAFELGNFRLMVDVIALPRRVLQHVLAALLHDRAGEGLRVAAGRRAWTSRPATCRTRTCTGSGSARRRSRI